MRDLSGRELHRNEPATVSCHKPPLTAVGHEPKSAKDQSKATRFRSAGWLGEDDQALTKLIRRQLGEPLEEIEDQKRFRLCEPKSQAHLARKIILTPGTDLSPTT